MLQQDLLPTLTQASFSIGQLALEWRCWGCAVAAFDAASWFSEVGNDDSAGDIRLRQVNEMETLI